LQTLEEGHLIARTADESKMAARWGKVLYWNATILAGLVAMLAAASYHSNAVEGDPIVPITALLLAGVIWLIGWICRYLLVEY
jgi:hypothetical protein